MTDKKAILSILTALAISVSASCPIAAAGDEDTNVLAHFDFDSASLDGNFGTAEAVGNLTYEDTAGGKCAALSDNGYIKLTSTDKLVGKDDITIAMRIKQNASDTSWWFFAAPDDTAQKYKYEKYLGIMGGNSKLTAERYKNDGERRLRLQAL